MIKATACRFLHLSASIIKKNKKNKAYMSAVFLPIISLKCESYKATQWVISFGPVRI